MDRVAGKIALVTGAAQGMGAAHARLLVKEGARVVLADLNDAAGEALAAELGENARYVHLDVTDYPAWEAAIAFTVAEFGGLDVLVNNAGIVNFTPLPEFPLDLWDKTLAVNLTSVFYGMRAAFEPLRNSGKGSVVNISSVAGLVGLPAMPAYNATKFGVRGITKSAALDFGPHNIRVNSIHPGTIRTPMTADLAVDQSHVALERAADPEEVSALVLYLASDDSSFSTGAEFIVDGGQTTGYLMPSPVK
ncbi:3alpha(or 20beta)-hydroxysteroid dehydrogenase [Leucobacter luti]|uniref:3alpha(Or 20beta)-hydroxysteroid dehydrogenase n=1 Tax=Leucobacter luti TaxID=340320 RepID=A0A4R6RVG1_9MICO|nr:glucose 1-dehydrogenase [Leucobacter luti]TDP90407.1 3alpha(or 20beta)-hydroxysteroid dehydrogenase [Leucobacter luti]